MKESIFSKKRILLLGSGELGKELVIESKRLGLEVIAIDRYEKAPAMQVADYSRVIDMGDKNLLSLKESLVLVSRNHNKGMQVFLALCLHINHVAFEDPHTEQCFRNN